MEYERDLEVLQYMETCPKALAVQEVQIAFQISRQQVHIILKRLLKAGRIKKIKRGVYGSLHVGDDFMPVREREIRWVAQQQKKPFRIGELATFVGYSSWSVGKVLRQMFRENLLIRGQHKTYIPISASVSKEALTAKTRIHRFIQSQKNAVTVKLLMDKLSLKRGTANLAIMELVAKGLVKKIARGLYSDPEKQKIGTKEIQRLFDFIKKKKMISKKEIRSQFGEKATDDLKKLMKRGVVQRCKRGWYEVK